MAVTDSADIAIVGGGPVGAALGLALESTGLDVLILEARSNDALTSSDADGRPLALSHGSRLILERLGVWGSIASTPIGRIHISQAGGYGRVMLDARETGLPAYGYVVSYGELARALRELARRRLPRYRLGARVSAVRPGRAQAIVEYVQDDRDVASVTAALVVVADGGALVTGSHRQVRDYGQSAVTARIVTERPHGGSAYERFTRDGPLALLPLRDELALVWTTRPERAVELCELAEDRFLSALQSEFGDRLGALRGASGRAVYPLVLKFAQNVTLPHTVLIGNAAQTLHPVAGQGFNLGLRDAWELADEISACEPEQLGQDMMLARVRRRRRIDRRGSIAFTDFLVRMFSNDTAPLRAARGVGLALLDSMPPLKNFVARRMTFGTRG